MNKIIYTPLFLFIFSSAHAGKPLLESIKDLVIINKFYSRYKLYDLILKKNKSTQENEKIMANLISNNSQYLDLIEQSIVKREHNGSKAEKLFAPDKILLGITELTASAGLCYGLYKLDQKYCERIKLPAILISTGLTYAGIKNIYKGRYYNKRMESKLSRDKAVRTFLREISHQI